MPRFTFASSRSMTASRLRELFGSSMFLERWTLPVAQIFLPGFWTVFPVFPGLSWDLCPGSFVICYPPFQVCPWLLSWPLDIPIQFSPAHRDESFSNILVYHGHSLSRSKKSSPGQTISWHLSHFNFPHSGQHLNTSPFFSFCRRNLCSKFNGKMTSMFIESRGKASSRMLSSNSITESKPVWRT